MREQFVVPAIRGREVTWAQRSGVGYSEDALQPFDFSNGLFRVHRSQSSRMKRESVKQKRRWSCPTNSFLAVNVPTTACPLLVTAITAQPPAPDHSASRCFPERNPDS